METLQFVIKQLCDSRIALLINWDPEPFFEAP